MKTFVVSEMLSFDEPMVRMKRIGTFHSLISMELNRAGIWRMDSACRFIFFRNSPLDVKLVCPYFFQILFIFNEFICDENTVSNKRQVGKISRKIKESMNKITNNIRNHFDTVFFKFSEFQNEEVTSFNDLFFNNFLRCSLYDQ